MRRFWLIGITLIFGTFLATNGVSIASDATGEWTFTENRVSDTCVDYDYSTEKGRVVVVQNGTSLTITEYKGANGAYTNADGTYSGTIQNGNKVIFTNKFHQLSGNVTKNYEITLTSDTHGVDNNVNWTWEGYGEEAGYSCDGVNRITIDKQPQNSPLLDGSGVWTYTESGHSNNCGTQDQAEEGEISVSQVENKVTVDDDKGRRFEGFVNGATYTLIRWFDDPKNSNAKITVKCTISLGSDSTGDGKCHWLWNEFEGGYIDDSCTGSYDISITKKAYTITASAGPGGSISPSGSVSVEHGATQTFWFTPDPGYIVVSILYDGILYEARNWPGADVIDVVADHTLRVIFERIKAMPWLIPLLDDD